MRAAPHCSG
ncbi:hypothetical protein U9M48_020087 [Paspalum notatum var. saurae]|uniref:Uncharacterized protein n=1 Tax=Paspalum notatum var. saurae TaxID=547442 RepID=A0AAQ3TCL6_PASNO